MSKQKIDINLHGGQTSVRIDGQELENIKGLKVESTDKDLEHFDITIVFDIASQNVDISLEEKEDIVSLLITHTLCLPAACPLYRSIAAGAGF